MMPAGWRRGLAKASALALPTTRCQRQASKPTARTSAGVAAGGPGSILQLPAPEEERERGGAQRGPGQGLLKPPGPRPAPRPPSGPRRSRAPRGSILTDPVPLPGPLAAAAALTDPGGGRPRSVSGAARSSGPSGLRDGGGAGSPSQRGTQRNRKGSPRGQGPLPGPMVLSANRKARQATGPPEGISTPRVGVRVERFGLQGQALTPETWGMWRFLSVWGSGFSAAPLELDLDHLLPAWA